MEKQQINALASAAAREMEFGEIEVKYSRGGNFRIFYTYLQVPHLYVREDHALDASDAEVIKSMAWWLSWCGYYKSSRRSPHRRRRHHRLLTRFLVARLTRLNDRYNYRRPQDCFVMVDELIDRGLQDLALLVQSQTPRRD